MLSERDIIVRLPSVALWMAFFKTTFERSFTSLLKHWKHFFLSQTNNFLWRKKQAKQKQIFLMFRFAMQFNDKDSIHKFDIVKVLARAMNIYQCIM